MLKRCRICGKERTADEQKSKYGKNPYFCVECNEKRLNRIGKQLESLVHNDENFEPKNYKQEIKAFLTFNPNSNANQIWNGIGGSQRQVIDELKSLIENGEVTYSFIDYIYCVR